MTDKKNSQIVFNFVEGHPCDGDYYHPRSICLNGKHVELIFKDKDSAMGLLESFEKMNKVLDGQNTQE